jgi:thiamine transport system substrate-binding protein
MNAMHRNTTRRTTRSPRAAIVALGLIAAACSSTSSAPKKGTGTVRLVTHDSFVMSDAVKAAFTTQTGYTLEIVPIADAGATLNRAILTKDDPLGDVLFGVDSILLSRATDAGIFTRYSSSNLDSVPESLHPNNNQVTPIDRGDVCVIADSTYFADRQLPIPQTFDDLATAANAKLLVTQDPASSTPGLAFMLASIARYGTKWTQFWDTMADDINVTAGWTEAYDNAYSAGPGEGNRPLMVSYATSPAADAGRSTVLTDTCFGQIEYAGILANAANPKGAAALIDFMLSRTAQDDLAASMYVNPVRGDATVPEEFRRFAATVSSPRTLPAADIERSREQWIDEWTNIVRG